MAYPVTAGYGNIASNTMRYVPTIYFTGKLLEKFYDATVISEIANTDFEGTVRKQGDTVLVRTRPNISVSKYVKGQRPKRETPESAAVSILVDKGAYWSFVVDSVDAAQTDLKQFTGEWTDEASEQMKIYVDTNVLGTVYADVDTANQGAAAGFRTGKYNLGTSGAPVAINKTNILEVLTDTRTVLGERSIPDKDRWIVVPPAMTNLIMKSDLKSASVSGDGISMMRNGRIGIIAGYTVYESNLLTQVTDSSGATSFNVLFGHRKSLTFATQLIESKVKDNPDGFGMLYEGLQVFGYQMTIPTAAGNLYCTLT